MLVKIVTFFLIGMVVLAMFGKLRLSSLGLRRPRLGAARTCPACGRPVAGRGGCPCGAGRRG